MGALALLLDVRLRKPGVYALNPTGAAATTAHTETALRWSQRAVWLAALVSALLSALLSVFLGSTIGSLELGA